MCGSHQELSSRQKTRGGDLGLKLLRHLGRVSAPCVVGEVVARGQRITVGETGVRLRVASVLSKKLASEIMGQRR